MENASQTTVTCSACGQAAQVPFVPTAGRPVYCRTCFAKRTPAAPRGAMGRPAGRGFSRAPRASEIPNARKRMLSMRRKGHFMYDANELLNREGGGMESENHRAFLEGLFARGARHDVDNAREFLDEKLADETITEAEHDGLADLLGRYSKVR